MKTFLAVFSLAFLFSSISSKAFYDYTYAPFYSFVTFSTLFVVLFIYHIRKKKPFAKDFSINLIDIILLFYLGYVFINTAISSNFDSQKWIVCLFLSAYYTFFRIYQQKILFLIPIFLFAGLLQCIISYGQHFSLVENIDEYFVIGGTFGNPNVLAIFLTLTVPAAILAIFCYRNAIPLLSVLGIAFLVLVIPLLILSQCRTAVVGICAFIIVFLLLKLKRNKPIIFGIAFSFLSFLIFFLSSSYKEESATGRILVYKVSLRMIPENPVLGFGYGNFTRDYNNYQAAFFRENGVGNEFMLVADSVNTAYNEFLQDFVEGGVVGFFLLIGLFIIPVYYLVFNQKISHQNGKGIEDINVIVSLSMIVSLFFMSLINYTLSVIPIHIYFIFYLVLLSSSLPRISWKVPKIILLNNIWLYAIVTITFLVAANQLRRGFFKYKYSQAKELAKTGAYKQAYKSYELCYPYLDRDGNFLYDYGFLTYKLQGYSKSLALFKEASMHSSNYNIYLALAQNLETLGDFGGAERNYIHASFLVPNRFVPKHLLLEFYKRRNSLNQAHKVASEILKMEVKVPSEKVKRIKNMSLQFLNMYNLNLTTTNEAKN